MKALYAYFGTIGLDRIDMPGHPFYQVGLMDSIAVEYGVTQFDTVSYLKDNVIEDGDFTDYPTNEVGFIFHEYLEKLKVKRIVREEARALIREKKYDLLFLKARFRNLSTLSKKWDDAKFFEELIRLAKEVGYTRNEIVVLDTDLSLPDWFYKTYGDSVTILIPSIDIPGISERFLMSCFEYWKEAASQLKRWKLDDQTIVFYGNVDTSNYKAGNEKSSVLSEILKSISDHSCIISKSVIRGDRDIHRREKSSIWNCLSQRAIMLNVSKDKYNSRQFIPARVYEAMIFGMIPVSYGFNWLCPTFSFQTPDELDEIYTYLSRDCSDNQADLFNAYSHFVKSYLEWEKHRTDVKKELTEMKKIEDAAPSSNFIKSVFDEVLGPQDTQSQPYPRVDYK